MPHTHKDVANIDMIVRMVRAAGRTAGEYDPDQLARLAAVKDAVDRAMIEAVAGQRAAGVTWQTIGDALGVTRQAMIMYYGPKIDELWQSRNPGYVKPSERALGAYEEWKERFA